MGYVVEAGARRIYFAGDTDLFPAMADLDRPDIALIPVGGWGLTRGRGHLDPRDAAEALTLIRPRVAVPIHWGTFWPRGLGAIRPSRGPGAAGHFARFAGEVAPAVQIAIAQPGEQVPLDEGQAA
jgi:L-ascorbate metabolism protein UlaG (beta-lactamase superfamily)